ncbi:ABC transporter ATP-binding protein [Salmonella enterica]|uniref:ABC transporter ATP-binding protein n=1 Tax=Salmonella senftenberg TaxID=28150 RepID=A0A3V9FPG0_SALSE|nr:hypothetical protein C3F37_17875 [Salmonella enterica subsp. enterica serovar Senftenberg]EAQ1868486.1 ABC transporter ATP-binding protein [Salmonella enterica]EBP3642531.1 ABC transporter ATP-binding protein [Salmonella enterica subsp. enterica]EBW2307642.1 ABC transporter ATP-binding protein [Salmonella enterica subsp. enterica serovar Kingston]ECD7396365.1 ABC transporter ATP-binding protein [Salmonella enterica subsp. enterica serovar Westhampton]
MTCQDKSLLAPALASTPVIPRYRQIIRKRAVLMLAIALAMMASLMVDVTCGSSGLPLSALDLNYQFHVMDLVRRDTQAQNRVTIVVAHDINIALRHGDHVLMLKDGRLVASGAPETVITAERLAEVYRVRGRVERCSQGKLQVVLDGVIAV